MNRRGRKRKEIMKSKRDSVRPEIATILGIAVCLWLSWGCGSSDTDSSAAGNGPSVPVGGLFEATLDIPVEEGNPYDPGQVSVEAVFAAPNGTKYLVPGFVFQEYERALEDGFEKLSVRGEPVWRVRFTPGEAGTWHWRWTLTRPGMSETEEGCAFHVADSGEPFAGWVRVSQADRRYLCLDDGSPFFAVGENLCWYDSRGTFAYDDWLEKLAERGANYVRLWMPSWAFGLEWTRRDPQGTLVHSSLGNYADRMDRAWQLDRVVEKAGQLGIRVMLCIQNHGPFSRTHNTEWPDNPYNAVNGGPLNSPAEFFSEPEARALFRQRLRYILARWGYATNILAWELWNEVDLVDPPSRDRLASWHREMAGAIRSLDPSQRPVSTSLGGGAGIADTLLDGRLYGPLWDEPGIDFTQIHFYTVDGVGVDFDAVFSFMANALALHGKPVLVGEAGVDFRGPGETLQVDPDGEGFHDILWGGVFSGSCGTGMTWWWDNVVDPQGWYEWFRPVARFTQGIAFDREGFRSGGVSASAPGRDLKAEGLLGEGVALGWVRNANHRYDRPDPSRVEGAVLRISGLAAGMWRGVWIDTRTSETLGTVRVEVSGAHTELAVPDFARDVALRLKREGAQGALRSEFALTPLP
jgi:hypothetical protein